MDNKQKQEVGQKRVSLSDIFNGTLNNEKPRFYDTDNLSELLCHRYNLSRHTKPEYLVELVKQELDILL